MSHLLLRVRQTLFHVQHVLPGWSRPPKIQPYLGWRLRPGTEEIFRRLSTGDQIHSISVAQQLRAHGASEELVVAGPLHDIGKIRGPYRITVAHRIALLLVRRIVPGAVERLRDLPDPPRKVEGYGHSPVTTSPGHGLSAISAIQDGSSGSSFTTSCPMWTTRNLTCSKPWMIVLQSWPPATLSGL